MASWIAAATLFAGLSLAQTPGRILGTVIAVEGQGFTMKSDAGETVTVVAKPEARVQRVAPGERDLSKAEKISLAEFTSGDRVLVRGPRNDSIVEADLLVLMPAKAIAQKNESEQQAWRQRGMFGVVDQVDASSGEVRISVRTQGEARPVTVATNSSTTIKRYKPESIRFADAVEGKLAEMTKGDQLRVLGEKDAAGTRITAEQIVFGTFRTVAGTVSSVSAASNEVVLKDIQTGHDLTIRTRPDSQLKKFGMNRPGGMPMGEGPQRGAGPVGGGMPGGAAPGGFRAGAAPDLSMMLDRMPPTTLAELKQGDTVIVSSTAGSKPNELTAIVLLSGAEMIIAQLTARAESRRGQDPMAASSSLDRGLEGMMGMPIQ